jgi:hypothetical protein
MVSQELFHKGLSIMTMLPSEIIAIVSDYAVLCGYSFDYEYNGRSNTILFMEEDRKLNGLCFALRTAGLRVLDMDHSCVVIL